MLENLGMLEYGIAAPAAVGLSEEVLRAAREPPPPRAPVPIGWNVGMGICVGWDLGMGICVGFVGFCSEIS